MRQLSNGYGFIHNRQENEAYILSPTGLATWQKSSQTVETAKKLAQDGLGGVVSAQQMKNLTELTNGYGILA